MKFGGTSVGNAERIARAAEIVRGAVPRRPLVVVSALGGVTDLLERAVVSARLDDLPALEPTLAELERRHRWAVTGALEDPDERHRLSLELDREFESLRGRLRSIRILGEGTSRAVDAVMAFGESCASRLFAAALAERGIAAVHIPAERLMRTDGQHGAARPQIEETRAACSEHALPRLDAGSVPVVGGYVGAAPDGQTTTLGRGGSDTTAAVLGLALDAEEIQIWTDVDGMMTADPRLVPGALPLERLSFAEAAELAFYGARVLHPASVAPAVEREIPVRVSNAARPAEPGTLIVGRRGGVGSWPIASIASLDGVSLVRVREPALRRVDACGPALARAVVAGGGEPILWLSGQASVALVARGSLDAHQLRVALAGADLEVEVEIDPERALVTVVGAGLDDAPVRRRVLAALAEISPDAMVAGASPTSVSVLVPADRLHTAVRTLHERFFTTRGMPA